MKPVAMSLVVSGLRRICLVLALVCALTPAAYASERYALVVTGASGGPQYAEKYNRWREAFLKVLRDDYGYPIDHVEVLAESAGDGARVATRGNVRTALAAIRERSTSADLVTILVMGHGASVDGGAAKFNLVGPDLSAAEWASLIRPIAGTVVFVDTASGSFPYLEQLAGRHRVVVTANDNPAQQYETVFPEFFVAAFADDEADADKNGKVSVWEAFVFASAKVGDWFEERGQLATERPMIDDDGDGIGREAGEPGADGLVARTTYLRPDPPIPVSGNAEVDALRRRRAALDAELERLRVRKETMRPDDYERALETVLIEMSRIDRRLRTQS